LLETKQILAITLQTINLIAEPSITGVGVRFRSRKNFTLQQIAVFEELDEYNIPGMNAMV
jgi:hypothetical protein